MAQPPDHPLFAFSQPFTGSATQVNALISRGLQAVSELPAGACAAQSMASSAFAAEVMATRETAGARGLWGKGAKLNRGTAGRWIALAQEIIVITPQTAAAITVPVQAPRQAAVVAAAASPVTARKKNVP